MLAHASVDWCLCDRDPANELFCAEQYLWRGWPARLLNSNGLGNAPCGEYNAPMQGLNWAKIRGQRSTAPGKGSLCIHDIVAIIIA